MKAVIVENISKMYRIGLKEQMNDTLSATITNLFTSPIRNFNKIRKLSKFNYNENSNDIIWALKNISFELNQGEVLGIIGKNGAGKSTLLKILSRITKPTEGRVIIDGRVASLLEVGTGFHYELSGRENIYLNGTILGMKKKEIDKKFDEIVEFSGVEKFIDTPVKRYSSGMGVRLAFAIAAHLDPEILIIDEVLAVGDIEFQKKCLGKMKDVATQGRTVLFVSHSIAAVRQLCSKAILIESGKITSSGDVNDVVDTYLKKDIEKSDNAIIHFERNPDKPFQVLSARLINNRNVTTQKFECDEDVIIEIECEARTTTHSLYGYLAIFKQDGTEVMMSDSFDSHPNPLDALVVGTHSLRITVPKRTLAPGSYFIYMNFTMHSHKDWSVDSPKEILSFQLNDSYSKRGNGRSGFFSTMLKWEKIA